MLHRTYGSYRLRQNWPHRSHRPKRHRSHRTHRANRPHRSSRHRSDRPFWCNRCNRPDWFWHHGTNRTYRRSGICKYDGMHRRNRCHGTLLYRGHRTNRSCRNGRYGCNRSDR